METAVRLVCLWGEYLLDESTVLPGELLRSGPWLLEAVEVARPREVLRERAPHYCAEHAPRLDVPPHL